MVSTYTNKVLNKKLFPECWDKSFKYFIHFVEKQDLYSCDRHIQLQTSLFPLEDINYVAKFENFESEFNYIINEKLGLNKDIVFKNVSKHKHYSKYYDEYLLRFNEEPEMFGAKSYDALLVLANAMRKCANPYQTAR